MMCKILIRNVSDPAPSIVLVYDLNLNSVWVRSDVHPVSLHFDILRRRRSGWECTQGSQWKLETGSHQKFGEPHFNATWPDLQLEGMLSQLLIIFSIYIYTYIIYIHIFPMISIHFIPDLYPLAHSKISKWPADQETTAWPHLEDLWSMWSGAWSSGEWNWIRPRRDHSVTWCHLWHFSGYWRV